MAFLLILFDLEIENHVIDACDYVTQDDIIGLEGSRRF